VDLTSPAEVSALLDQAIPAGSAAAVAAACAAASAVVRGYLRSTVTTRRATTVLPWAATLTVPDGPVQAVHAVTVAGVPAAAWTLAGDMLAVPGRTGQAVEVDATTGWADGSWQSDVARNVATRVAARSWTNPMQRTSYTGPEGLAYAGPDVGARLLTPDERAALDALRPVVLA